MIEDEPVLKTESDSIIQYDINSTTKSIKVSKLKYWIREVVITPNVGGLNGNSSIKRKINVRFKLRE